jgi:hypothetical protein
MFLRLILARSDRARACNPARQADAGRVLELGFRGTRLSPAPRHLSAAEPADREPDPGEDGAANSKAGRGFRDGGPEGPRRRRGAPAMSRSQSGPFRTARDLPAFVHLTRSRTPRFQRRLIPPYSPKSLEMAGVLLKAV